MPKCMQAVRMAYSQCPSFDVLVPAMLEHGPLVRCQMMARVQSCSAIPTT